MSFRRYIFGRSSRNARARLLWTVWHAVSCRRVAAEGGANISLNAVIIYCHYVSLRTLIWCHLHRRRHTTVIILRNRQFKMLRCHSEYVKAARCRSIPLIFFWHRDLFKAVYGKCSLVEWKQMITTEYATNLRFYTSPHQPIFSPQSGFLPKHKTGLLEFGRRVASLTVRYSQDCPWHQWTKNVFLVEFQSMNIVIHELNMPLILMRVSQCN